MDSATTLILALVFVHVTEGLQLFAVVEPIVVTGSWRTHIEWPAPLVRSWRGTVSLRGPLPPLGWAFGLPFAPVAPGVDGGWVRREGVGLEGVGGSWSRLDVKESDAIVADGRRLRWGSVVVPTVSYTAAQVGARTLSELRDAASSGARRTVIQRHLRQAFDLSAIEARLSEFGRASRWVHVVGQVTTWGLLLFAAAFFRVRFVYAHGLELAGAVLVSAIVGAVLMFRCHRRLYPELKDDRFTKVMLMAVSPLVAGRARMLLARDLLVGFHPLAGARVMLDEGAFSALAALVWRRMRYPLASSADVDPEWAQAELSSVEAFLRRCGLEPERFVEPPEREGSAEAYCPRCLAQYQASGGECSDCPGVALLSFDPPF